MLLPEKASALVEGAWQSIAGTHRSLQGVVAPAQISAAMQTLQPNCLKQLTAANQSFLPARYIIIDRLLRKSAHEAQGRGGQSRSGARSCLLSSGENGDMPGLV